MPTATLAGRESLIEKIKKENNFKENLVAKKDFLKVIDTTVCQGKWEANKATKLGNKELFNLGTKKSVINYFDLFSIT